MSENGDVGRSRSPSPNESPAHSEHSYHKSRSKSRSYSRSRSRSRSHHHKRRRSYSRSRSRSRSYSRPRYSRSPKRSRHGSRSRSRDRGRKGRRQRTRSRSPMSSRRRHFGNRDDPEPSKCLGVFGLSLYTQERDLRDVFGRYGEMEECNVVYDRQSGRSRGFAFVYFRNVDDAIEAKDRCTGIEIDGRRIRVDYSITRRAHTPTPGIYLGKPTGRRDRYEERDRYDDYHGGSYSRRRSPSPYYGRSRRYSRSRSRSYSPRRYY